VAFCQLYSTPNTFSGRSPHRTPLEEFTALPQTPAGLRGPTSKGGEGKESGRRGEREGMEGAWEGKGGRKNTPSINSCLRP